MDKLPEGIAGILTLKLSAFSIQLSAFSDQLSVGFDLRDDGSSRALCGEEIDNLLNGSIGPVIGGFNLELS